MSVEKYIHGKVDEGKHEGKASEVRRLAETDEEILDFWRTVWPEIFEHPDLEDDDPPIDKDIVP
jgi:hypothetical protein